MEPGGESLRQQKVGRQVQKDLSEMLRAGGSSYAMGKMVSVTRVRMSPDLGYAKVYLSIFPSEGAADVVAHMRNRTSELRYQLGKLVRHQLRVVPELDFRLDDSLDYIARIDEALGGASE